AISSSNGTLPMKISQEGYDAWNSLAKPTRGDNYDVETVETQRLDDFIQANKLMGKIKMVKIDVEGWEYEVLNGGLEFFSEQGALIIQIELNEDALQGAGSSSKSLIEKFTSLGYQLYKYDGQKNELISFVYHNEDLDTNLYAIKNLELVNELISKGGNKPLCPLQI
ncbi:MAG: FkbM family methyltransferase, partial [Chloroflexota bacterium]